MRLRHRLPAPVQGGLRRARRALRRASWRLRRRLQPQFPAVPAAAVPAAFPDTPVRLVVGPANFAGQGFAWARAAESLPGVSAQSVAVVRSLRFPVDLLVEVPVYRSQAWGELMERHVVGGATHVLIESMRPLLGIRHGEDCAGDLRVLARHGLSTALLAHGSDVRLPSRHAELYPWSPFRDGSVLDGRDLDGWDEHVQRLEAQARRFGDIMAAFEGPTFVSTADLLDFVPDATWLPTIVDAARWACDRPVLRSPRPVVLHAPSNARLKGSEHVEQVMARLQDEGLVTYRRVERVDPGDMPALVAGADIVVEQLVLGLYSVAAIEAMAAGRLVLAHVHDRVRARLPRPLPVVEADPLSLERVLREVLTDGEHYREVAQDGPEYVREVHDGRRSARALATWLGQDA